ncbi:unnamed protein product [Cuscuta campestris]|uniref:Phosphatidylinositol 4-phosphate 5-kinase n=2 Tax=Cuscuta sect. Cleistogrammica TaxID=1824901 RepID=A0A484M783_9ASTE|nr:hypothetical protein DM860_013140 [Cuscuta australis]VFQ83928.1 unnamed protein product [Cuscuta campestris]
MLIGHETLIPKKGKSEEKREDESETEGRKGFEITTTTPRSVIIIPRSKSHGTIRRVTPTSSTAVVEKRLSNGDLYVGDFFLNAPHGSGKYLWADGCMYEGEWKRGKASGKGKFSWPSGAIYKGEFRSGRMEGTGTFIGPGGDMYKGAWLADHKHGFGQKLYCNGDYYEGHWKRNLQDGQGRYVWQNGNEYIGEWMNGTIHGRGVLIWSNQNRYAGCWENGAPKGHGVFTWPDGSCYMGYWSQEERNQHHTQVLNWTLYPARTSKTNLCHVKNDICKFNFKDEGFYAFSRHTLGSPLIEDGNCGVAVTGEEIKYSVGRRESLEGRSFPRICIWESDGDAGDIICNIVDTMEPMEPSRLYWDGVRQFRRKDGKGKKPGQSISKGHKDYDLMLNLQLGISFSVGKHALVSRELKPSDFDPKEKFWTKFPPEGSKFTPPHKSAEFRWKDYCPLVFRRLRELFQVDTAGYTMAVCGDDALRMFSSPGKSGSCFYLTQDDRFMIKTVKKSEVKVLIKMLPSYYQHVCRYENSLVTKFYGVHCVKPVGGMKTRFIVMGNLFCSEYQIHRRFDLKGSSYGRTTDKHVDDIDETTTLKDLDLNFVFRLQQNWYLALIRQIDLDCEFLESERIMDYSFLVGLHFRGDNTSDKMGLSPFLLRTGKSDSFQNEKFMRGCRFLEAELQDMDQIIAGRKPLIHLGANMPARAERIGRRSDFDQYIPGRSYPLPPSRAFETYEVILYSGIIDILQDYDISKKLEHVYKSFQVDPTSISAVDPKLYSRRFRDFIRKIFVEDSR